jgi:hypothetical protein
VFWVFAASAPLGLVAGASAEDLRRALEGKELACLHRFGRGRLERITSPLTLASDLGKRRSAQR